MFSSGSRGAEGAMPPPPRPVKISHKKDGCQRRPHRFHVSRPPPYPTIGSATDVNEMLCIFLWWKLWLYFDIFVVYMVGKGGNTVNTSFFIVLLSSLKGEKNVITNQIVEVADAYETLTQYCLIHTYQYQEENEFYFFEKIGFKPYRGDVASLVQFSMSPLVIFIANWPSKFCHFCDSMVV